MNVFDDARELLIVTHHVVKALGLPECGTGAIERDVGLFGGN